EIISQDSPVCADMQKIHKSYSLFIGIFLWPSDDSRESPLYGGNNHETKLDTCIRNGWTGVLGLSVFHHCRADHFSRKACIHPRYHSVGSGAAIPSPRSAIGSARRQPSRLQR